MSWQLSIGVERVKCTHLDFSYRFFCCTSYFNLSNTKAAILKGYRPCKICKPLEYLNETPEYIRALVRDLSERPEQKFRDADLRERGIEPATLRRWFVKHHGMTFQAYQRMLRINSAFKKLHVRINRVVYSLFDKSNFVVSRRGLSYLMICEV